MNKFPTLLLVISHYNDDYNLLRCINSLSNIDNAFIKLLVIDDCSDKEFYLNAVNYCNLKSITLIRNSVNSGISNVRNKGIDFAAEHNFDYITFIDCDDHLIDVIKQADFAESEISIYNSLETYGVYFNHIEFNKYIIKSNINTDSSLNEMLTRYSITPNKVATLTSCWAKIYKMNIIKKNNIKFNEKMYNFEDIDFLVNFLIHSKEVSFIEKTLYAHTNNLLFNSASFKNNSNYNLMFGFLNMTRKLQLLFKQKGIFFNKFHFLACYYSITFIRLAINIRGFNDFIKLYDFIYKRLRSRLIIKCFENYDPILAGGKYFIKKLIILKQPLILTLYLIYIAKKRYN